MKWFFNQLLFPLDSDTKAVYSYLQLFDVPVTKTGLATLLGEHPDSGTLLSISDTLTGLGVENVVANVSTKQLEQLGIPFIARMKSGDGLALAVVKHFDHDTIVYLPSEGSTSSKQSKWITTNKEMFSKEFDGIILIGEVEPGGGQQNYAAARAAENRKHNSTITALAVFPTLVIVAVTTTLAQLGWTSAIPGLYTLLSLVGTVVSSLLLLYEVDRHNPAIRQICTGSRNVNCDAILNSGASGIFGISWSMIGFSYFMGSLLMLLAGGIANSELFSLISLLSLLAVGYSVFSLYYQWQIAKQWCKLCLWIQGILLAQASLILLDGKLFEDSLIWVSVPTMLTFAVCFAVPFLAVQLIVPTFKKRKEGESYRRELAKLKHNPQIFEALLIKQKAITVPTEGLGIRLGNPDAKHRIIKVCNPYCGPCAKSHPIIEEILQHSPDVQVQVIFITSEDEQDFSTSPVKHLLALAAKGDDMLLKVAMEDWYMPPNKDYEAFAAKYPMNGELLTQGKKLAAMRTWCAEMDILFTPTFFVDGYQLPEMYTVEDLKYILRT
ncbi:vitamin K epoxide reductase family protein [Anditalea andensis]|uniref:Vitamin K epoxide reductase domain-containing protein n=1 Tax=Anditalea andensis TaxID=1048983 RepID=A0A074L1F4_9BACT|nr:vitamin K epoxide reductase family protein [Anditalea andensis]KEO73663.1 hypothetical protein EL17_10995 [Anditalea andensis]